MKIRKQRGPSAEAMAIALEKDVRPLLPDGQAFLPDRRRREGSPELPHDLLFAVVERLIREKSELLEEVLQLRAAVSIYRRIAEQTTAARLAPKADAA